MLLNELTNEIKSRTGRRQYEIAECIPMHPARYCALLKRVIKATDKEQRLLEDFFEIPYSVLVE